ncbi:hypothetical protein WAI453_013186 [Rhynchosporium graminicola]
MAVFTALPLVVFILAVVTQLILCVFSLRAEEFKLTGVMTILFQSVRPPRLRRDGLPNHGSNNLLDEQLQNLTFGITHCCLGFATHTECYQFPVNLATLKMPLGSAVEIKDVYPLKAIASGIIHTSLAWAIVFTVIFAVTVAAIFSSRHCTFMQRLRTYGVIVKVFLSIWSIATCTFVMLPIMFVRQSSWDLRSAVGIETSAGNIVGLNFGALCCTLILSFCASFICSYNFL